MHTMQVHPGRCLGCLVVAPADGSSWSPRVAAVARASSPEGSHLCPGFSATFCFLESEKRTKYHILNTHMNGKACLLTNLESYLKYTLSLLSMRNAFIFFPHYRNPGRQ